MKYYKVVDEVSPEGDIYRFGEDGLWMKVVNSHPDHWVKSVGESIEELIKVVEANGGTVTEVENPWDH